MKIVFAIIVSILTTITFPSFAEAADTDKTLSITTNAFLDLATIPVLYTCDGKDTSPEMTWANVPARAQSLALILADPDAPGGVFYHWVVYNIPASVKTIPQGALPENAITGQNSFGKLGYNGPCPPKGASHKYIFTVYALDTTLSVPAGSDAPTVINAMQNHIVGKADLTGVYSRWFN